MANDNTVDNNKMVQIMAISLALKTFKLIIIIMNFSYFIGMFWLTMCNTIQDINDDAPEIDIEEDIFAIGGSLINSEKSTNFLAYHSITEYSKGEQALVSMYFAFTSLSTVGFGDYTPRSDPERVLGSVLLLFGVAIFSVIMGRFIEMVH